MLPLVGPIVQSKNFSVSNDVIVNQSTLDRPNKYKQLFFKISFAYYSLCMLDRNYFFKNRSPCSLLNFQFISSLRSLCKVTPFLKKKECMHPLWYYAITIKRLGALQFSGRERKAPFGPLNELHSFGCIE